MSQQIVIDPRFRGPPESANGGYVCGIVAGLVGGTAEVTLRRPPPIGRPLEVVRPDGGGVALRDGETVIAEGTRASVEIDVPDPVSFEEAAEATKSFVWAENHPYPTCFVCGPQRVASDSLCIFPGPIEGRNAVAAPWIPDASLGDESGTVRPEFVWSALDCPGAFAFIRSADDLVLLGRLAAKLTTPIRCGQRYVVIGWPLGSEGRRLYAGTALFSEAGTLHALARATWVRMES